VEDRFNCEILAGPKSFTRTDFDSLHSQYKELISSIRASTPDTSGPITPSSGSRRPSTISRPQEISQVYWNEYDHGSEAGDEPYMISINPDEESSFPGAKAFGYVMSKAFAPVGMMKQWLSPHHSPNERQALLGNGYFDHTDVEDEAYASSSELPSGYVAHYATFPSVEDQRLTRHQQTLLLQACIGSFGAAFVLLLIASILVATGRHKLLLEVDAGVITGVVASLFFALMGFACMLYRTDKLSWFHRVSVIITFLAVCVLDGMLLVLVAENTAL
jgi:hypothetical protein